MVRRLPDSISFAFGRATASLMLMASAASAGPYVDPGIPPAAMSGWADEVVAIARGPLDVALPALGLASFGDPALVLGPSVSNSFDVVSLGDGGVVTVAFAEGIGNGPGPDVAVFENGFFTIGGLFAELAFVEVSSNGVDFARFASASLQSDPVSSFDPIDPSDYDGLAGRHPIGLGTGFDLASLAAHPLVAQGRLDLTNVALVRIIDVVGDGSTADALARPIYDTYPTAFAAGGFDLEAIGVVHPAPEPDRVAGLVTSLIGLVGLSRRRPAARRCPAAA